MEIEENCRSHSYICKHVHATHMDKELSNGILVYVSITIVYFNSSCQLKSFHLVLIYAEPFN